MKRFAIFAVCLFALLLATSAFAQDPQRRPDRPQKGARLKKMDVNQDGRISRDEWKGNPRAFGKIDKNNDGSLTQEEFVAAGRGQGTRHLKQLDANNDGQISREEWKGNAEAFTGIDANNDGVLTREELKGRRRKI